VGEQGVFVQEDKEENWVGRERERKRKRKNWP
jgi:hypothetical protein